MWVAGGWTSGIFYSTDGKVWTQGNITDTRIESLYYDNGIWIAGNGNSSPGGTYYSFDGKNWTASGLSQQIIPFVYSFNGIWVVVSIQGLYYSPTWEPTIPAGDYKFILPLSAPSGNIMENIPFIANSINYTSLSVIQN